MSALSRRAKSRLEFLLDYVHGLTEAEVDALGRMCDAVEARDTEEDQ